MSKWTNEWPTVPGWYWVFDPKRPLEGAMPRGLHVALHPNGERSAGLWSGHSNTYPHDRQDLWFHPMEKPPTPPGTKGEEHSPSGDDWKYEGPT